MAGRISTRFPVLQPLAARHAVPGRQRLRAV
jgi:hypothetical protein